VDRFSVLRIRRFVIIKNFCKKTKKTEKNAKSVEQKIIEGLKKKTKTIWRGGNRFG
jgi:hypothetical protein